MIFNKTVVLALSLPVAFFGCSGSPPAPEAARPDPRPEVYEPVYRVATELRSAQEVGMNRRRFGELLEKLTTEIALAKDKAESAKEQRVIQGYTEVLQVYKDAASIWDVKLQIPELIDLAEEHPTNGNTDAIIRKANFKMAVADGIPLNFYPEGSTGIDELVNRYELPVKESEGWKTIPSDSVERVWSRARTKTEDVTKLQKD